MYSAHSLSLVRGVAALSLILLTAALSVQPTMAQETSHRRISVAVSPDSANVPLGSSQNFTAIVRHDRKHEGVTWTLSGVGSLSATSTQSGVPVEYTAPTSDPNPATVPLTATSVSDPSQSATATIVITVPAPVPSEPIVLGIASVAEGFGNPVVAVDPNNVIDAAWVNASALFTRSIDGGMTFPAGQPIGGPNLLGSATGAVIQESLDAQGAVNLLWSADITGQGMSVSNFFSRSQDGQIFTAPVNVATTAFSTSTAQLAVQPDEPVNVLWFDQVTSNLLSARSTDGTDFSSPTVVWPAGGSKARDLTVTAGPQGQVYAFWTQVINPPFCGVVLFSRSLDGVTWSPVTSISDTTACSRLPQSFVDPLGNLLVSWTDGTSLFLSRSTDSGVTFSSPATVTASGFLRHQQIALGPEGNIYVVWGTGGGVAALSRSTDDGVTFSAPVPLVVGDPVIAVDKCGTVDVVGQAFPKPGQVTMSLQYSTDSSATFSDPIALSNTVQDFSPRLALDGQGNLHVVYDVDGPQLVMYVQVPATCAK